MGRSQVKYRATHGRGRGRGGGRGGGGEPTGGDEASASSFRRTRGGGGGGRRPLESNAFRYEERQQDDDEGDEEAHAVAAAGGGQTHSFRRQFFAGEENVREISAAPSGAYFQSQTVKQWDAEDDDDPSAKSAIGVLDFNWIGEQLAMVAPSVRYQMDPKYCVDFDFEAPAAESDNEEEDEQHSPGQEDKAVVKVTDEPTSSSLSLAPMTAATKPASHADSELDLLLQLSSTTPSSSAQTSSSAAVASSVPAPTPQQHQSAAAPAADQLEDWLDDVLDM